MLEKRFSYKKAAEKGHAESQYDLAWMLLLGEGVVKSVPRAIQWFERSAHQGWEEAVKLLIELYQKGLRGVPRDTARANYWRDFRRKQ